MFRARQGGATPEYGIIATAGAGGSISPSGTVYVKDEESVTFTITPDAGYRIVSVTVDGVDKGALTSFTFEGVTEPHTIEAEFEAIPRYTITATAGEGGSISLGGEVSVLEGSDITFTIAPGAGYFIESVIVDGVDQGSVSSYKFTSVDKAHTIHAVFGEAAIITGEITDAGMMNALQQYFFHYGGGMKSEIRISDIRAITKFAAYEFSIKDISVLRYAVNLEELTLWYNKISDISPISGLTKLKRLNLTTRFRICRRFRGLRNYGTLTWRTTK